MDVLGRSLTLRGGTPERLQAIARLVDEQLRELQAAYPASALSEIAILVALNLADECLESKEGFEKLQAEVEERSRHLLQMLETQEAGSPPGP